MITQQPVASKPRRSSARTPSIVDATKHSDHRVQWALVVIGVIVVASAAAQEAPHDSVASRDPALDHTVVTDAVTAAETVTGAAVATLESPHPRISGSLSGRVQSKLENAFAIARQRVLEIDSCGEMFAELGSDGVYRLDTTLYAATTAEMDRVVCRGRDAVAFTYVDSPQTRLCPDFARLSNARAATAVLHEALHWAGLSEKPLDPAGITAGRITRMVQDRCGF